MIFKVLWSSKAEKQLGKLPKEISKNVIRKVRRAAETGIGIETLKEFKYGFKIRSGDYRALVDIYSDKDLIVIRKVGHRKNIYKR